MSDPVDNPSATTALDLAADIRSGARSARSVLEEHLAAIEAREDEEEAPEGEAPVEGAVEAVEGVGEGAAAEAVAASDEGATIEDETATSAETEDE